MYHRLTNCRNMFAVQKCFQHLPIYILSLICISSGADLQFKNSNTRKTLMKCCYFLNLLNDFFRNCFIFHSFTHLSQFAFIRVFKMSLSSFGNSNVTNSIETDNNNDEKKSREKKNCHERLKLALIGNVSFIWHGLTFIVDQINCHKCDNYAEFAERTMKRPL